MEDYIVQLISAAIGGIMAIVFEFMPGIKTWFEALGKTGRQLVIGAMALIVAALMFGANCAGLLGVIFPDVALSCDLPGAFLMIRVVIAVIGGAQAIHITVNKLINIIIGK